MHLAIGTHLTVLTLQLSYPAQIVISLVHIDFILVISVSLTPSIGHRTPPSPPKNEYWEKEEKDRHERRNLLPKDLDLTS